MGMAMMGLALAGPAAAGDGPSPKPGWRPRGVQEQPSAHEYPRVEIGYACVTSRGSCDLAPPRPAGTPCRCWTPGFGSKRGVVRP